MVAKFNFQGGEYVEETVDGPVSIVDGANAQGGSWTSDTAISAVVVKGGTDAKIVDTTGDGFSGTFNGTGLVNGGGNQPGISNVKFCTGQPTELRTGSVTVVKNVTGAVPEIWSFDFSTDTADITLSGTDLVTSDSEARQQLTGGTTFSVTEKTEQTTDGYEYVGFQCVRDFNSTEVDSGDATDRQADVQVYAGENITCTFTNRFPAPEPDSSLTLRKQVQNTSDWAIDLSCTTEIDEQEVVAAAVALNEQRVNNAAPSFECATEPGSYVIAEDLTDESPSNMSFVSVSCERPGEEGSISVTATQVEGGWTVPVEQGQHVTCTFVNSVPGVSTFVPPPPPVPASLTVEKVVIGVPDATAIPGTWSEVIDIDSVGSVNAVSNVSVNQDDLSEEQTLVAGTYRLDELGSDDPLMALTDIECTEANGAVSSSSGLLDADDLRDGIEVSLAQGSDMTCVFTNTYTTQVAPQEEEPGSITIVKAVEGPVPTGGWSFGFNVSDGVGRAVLTNADNDATFNSVVAGEYTIVEDASTAASLESIECNDPDAVTNGRTVSVDVGEGENVICTFTNVFPETAVQPAAEVKGVQTVRTLPRTGDETRGLAGVGAFMLALGAAMVIGSRRQLARR